MFPRSQIRGNIYFQHRGDNDQRFRLYKLSENRFCQNQPSTKSRCIRANAKEKNHYHLWDRRREAFNFHMGRPASANLHQPDAGSLSSMFMHFNKEDTARYERFYILNKSAAMGSLDMMFYLVSAYSLCKRKQINKLGSG